MDDYMDDDERWVADLLRRSYLDTLRLTAYGEEVDRNIVTDIPVPDEPIVHQACYAQFDRDRERIALLEATLHEALEAIRLTREYVGSKHLPAIEGWAWYDATVHGTLVLHARHALASTS